MKLQTKPFVPELPKMERDKLTVEEKLDRRISETQSQNRRLKLREHHYKLIEHEGKLILFNGNKQRINQFENSFKGKKVARANALSLFLNSANTNGGYLFDDFATNDWSQVEEQYAEIDRKGARFKLTEEIENDEGEVIGEIEVHQKTRCSNCQTRFMLPTDSIRHVCAQTWIILNFRVIQREFQSKLRLRKRFKRI